MVPHYIRAEGQIFVMHQVIYCLRNLPFHGFNYHANLAFHLFRQLVQYEAIYDSSAR